MYYLSTTEQGEKCEKIACVYIKGKIKKYIYLCFTKKDTAETESMKQVAFDADTFTNEDKYANGIFPYFRKMEDMNHRIMVIGASGSGKSVWIGKVVEQIAKTKFEPMDDEDEDPPAVMEIGMPLDGEIVIFSAIKSDPAFDNQEFNGRTPIRVQISSPNIMSIRPELFNNCILIFDDIESYSGDAKVSKFINKFRDECMENSRHYKTDLISVSHNALAAQKNKMVKHESTGVVVFPINNQYKSLSNFLTSYLGYDKTQVDYILKDLTKKYYSKFTFISKQNPQYLITSHSVELMD
jgi:hypothetical protein